MLACVALIVGIPIGMVNLLRGIRFYQKNAPLTDLILVPKVGGWVLTFTLLFLEWYFWIRRRKKFQAKRAQTS